VVNVRDFVRRKLQELAPEEARVVDYGVGTVSVRCPACSHMIRMEPFGTEFPEAESPLDTPGVMCGGCLRLLRVDAYTRLNPRAVSEEEDAALPDSVRTYFQRVREYILRRRMLVSTRGH
jgi:hypothetical protein